MRLVERNPEGELTLVNFDDDVPPYAILSHTWNIGEEVTFKEFVGSTGTSTGNSAGKIKLGWAKIKFCGEQAAEDGLRHFWVDTCCINKSTSDELSTAINSMFRWYKNAAKCYVYLWQRRCIKRH